MLVARHSGGSNRVLGAPRLVRPWTLSKEPLAALRVHQAQQAGYRVALPPGTYENRDLVFASPTGGILDADLFTKAWKRLCRAMGVDHKLHSLRHFHASTLLRAGVHLKGVSTRLGHSSVAITRDIFSHVSPVLDQSAADDFARAMDGQPRVLATGLAPTVTHKKHNRERRQPHEQHEQWPAMPSVKVEQVRGQEHRRGKGDREIPNSAHFWLLLAFALLSMLYFYSMTIMGCTWFALVGS